jgi:hypothetical protein
MGTSEKNRPTRQVLLQRVRNRIIEYLEVASSFEEQRKYQDAAPQLSVPIEVINQWEDWVSERWETELVEPVFSNRERNAIREFYALWKDVNQKLPEPLPKLDALFQLPAWEALRDGASMLSQTFAKRGKLSEEAEDV